MTPTAMSRKTRATRRIKRPPTLATMPGLNEDHPVGHAEGGKNPEEFQAKVRDQAILHGLTVRFLLFMP